MKQENALSANTSHFSRFFNRFDLDVFDIRDVIERYEALEALKAEQDGTLSIIEAQEFEILTAFFKEVVGQGGDEEWRREWYPLIFISERYFSEYCEELVKECGTIPRDMPWYIERHIDWDGVANDLRIDYKSVTIEGIEYWFR